MKSFKGLVKQAVEVLHRYGYEYASKLANFQECDVRIYCKSAQDGCMVAVHQGVECTMILSFHSQFISSVPSGILIMTFSSEGKVNTICSDLTSNRRYRCMLREMTELMR